MVCFIYKELPNGKTCRPMSNLIPYVVDIVRSIKLLQQNGLNMNIPVVMVHLHMLSLNVQT